MFSSPVRDSSMAVATVMSILRKVYAGAEKQRNPTSLSASERDSASFFDCWQVLLTSFMP